MIPYFVHASILLILFYVFYWLLLRKETFFKLNRFFLLLVIFAAAFLPLIHIPAGFSLQQNFAIVAENATTELSDHPDSKKDLAKTNSTIDKNTNPVLKNSSENIEDSVLTTYFENWSMTKIFWMVYLVGCLVFMVSFFIQFVTILLKKKNLSFIQDGFYRIYELKNDNAPFSFFNWIFINPKLYDPDTYNQILAHEKIHVSQSHFFDKILAEIALVFFWFNPFAWLYRKAINNNLEFLTDEEMLTKGTEKESYQISLLKVSVPEYALSLTTNYNQSFLQKRIKMMNAKKSSAQSSWKYLLLLPLWGFSVASMNTVDLESQPISQVESELSTSTLPESSHTLTKNIENLDLNLTTKSIDKNLNATLDTIPKKKRKQKNKLKNKNKNKSKNKIKNKNKAKYKGWGDIQVEPGHWVGRIEAEEVCFYFNISSREKNNFWHTNECFLRTEIKQLPIGKNGKFRITREAGSLIMEGGFAQQNSLGEGVFDFEADASFVNFLENQGLGKVDKKQSLSLFFSNTKKDFVLALKKEGYDFTLKNLIALGHQSVDQNSLKAANRIFKKIGHSSRKAKDLLTMTIHDLTESYVDEMIKIVPTNLNLKTLISGKIHDVSPEFAKSMKDYGFKNLTLKDLIKLSIHDVSIQDLEKLKNSGYQNISIKQALSFSIHQVSPENIKKFKEMGYDNLSPKKLVSFSIHDVSPSYIEEMKQAGFENLSADDLVTARIHNITGDYRKEMKSLGLTDLNFDNLKSGKIHGVSKSFIERARKKGYNPTTLREYIKLKIHGI